MKRTDIINHIFKKYNFTTYLEIGVHDPSLNFDKIAAVLKHSVDPNRNGNYTYNVTSDYFFKNCINNQRYDVIFIDGLHTEEQSYKDAKNAIKYIDNNGFIIMHDCNPINRYLARSYDDFLKTSGAWNGTVYRAFISLKYELKDWSCFVVNEDHGCGILTKRKIINNEFLNFDINNLSWDYFDKNREKLLQLISFEEYCKII